jgi:hypothetical protein
VLCDEISELKITAETNFYPAMVMFGQAPHGKEDEDIKEGDEELWMGRMLPFFQDLVMFSAQALNVYAQCTVAKLQFWHNKSNEAFFIFRPTSSTAATQSP